MQTPGIPPEPHSSPIVVREEGQILIVTFYSGSTDEQYRDHLVEMDRIMNLRRLGTSRWAVVIDATRWMRSNAVQRKMHADWMAKNEDVMRTRTAGIAFAVDNAFVRGGLTAVLWLSPLPCPHTVVKTPAEAMQWAHAQLAAPARA